MAPEVQLAEEMHDILSWHFVVMLMYILNYAR